MLRIFFLYLYIEPVRSWLFEAEAKRRRKLSSEAEGIGVSKEAMDVQKQKHRHAHLGRHVESLEHDSLFNVFIIIC